MSAISCCCYCYCCIHRWSLLSSRTKYRRPQRGPRSQTPSQQITSTNVHSFHNECVLYDDMPWCLADSYVHRQCIPTTNTFNPGSIVSSLRFEVQKNSMTDISPRTAHNTEVRQFSDSHFSHLDYTMFIEQELIFIDKNIKKANIMKM